MSNSSLVTYTNLSSHNSGTRTHAIDRITPHCIVGQWTAKQGCDYFKNTDRQASANYVVGKDGSIGLGVEESKRAWTTSSKENDQRAVTIETASDTTAPYKITDAAYNSLINLMTDICKRNGKTKILWFADKAKSLSYVPKSNEMVITVHRWFASTACPGDYIYSHLGDIATKVQAKLDGKTTTTTASKPAVVGTQAKSLVGMTTEAVIKKVAALFTQDEKKTGVLACVSLAQFILESGNEETHQAGQSLLAVNANNCFGMKTKLSGNTWSGSTWDGKSIYEKKTQEWDGEKYTTITAPFRKYACIEDSIADHSAYLLGAMKGTVNRYAGLKGCKDYKKALQIIKDGGYATSPTYVANLCAVVEKYNLTQYNYVAPALVVDGSWGVKTTKMAQKVFGTVQDGTISNQPSANKKYLPNASTASWEFKASGYSAGSSLIKAIQKKIGTTADGYFGKASVKALQTFLAKGGFYKGDIDGSMGSMTVKAFQAWLNKQ